MIYFIKHTDYIKIGYTHNIKYRLSQLQTSCPVKLIVLGLIQGTIEDEAFYHKKFIHLCTIGEWFKHTKEIDDFIYSLPQDLMWKHGFIVSNPSVIGLIKSCRLEKNLTMEDLGERMGITKQSIKDLETREMQGKVTLATLNKALSAMGYRYESRVLLLDK